jgi:hypothetical protein
MSLWWCLIQIRNMTPCKLEVVSVQKSNGYSSHLSYCMVFLAIRHYGADMIHTISIALKYG